ncbi:acyl carrier protein [Candidatus Nitrospira allomarina]|jgi:acyl carrier protein|uniref:Acyl carrier protein n=1 Tax=Candidatus Nitrospira allomarina TaxID=3020900 RepID=A0AA96GD06_9BACT|nr:acyl carrier protein [Candidatus Nitrospira allomarina]WNM57940.1 acyl carrier protein [Candidatus Nitrospira allomarina]
MSNTHARVIEFLSIVLQVDIPTDIDDLQRREFSEWDSINHLRLIMELEEILGVTLEDEQAADLSSSRQIEALFIRHGVTLPDEASA